MNINGKRINAEAWRKAEEPVDRLLRSACPRCKSDGYHRGGCPAGSAPPNMTVEQRAAFLDALLRFGAPEMPDPDPED